MKKMIINGIEFSYTLTEKRFNTQIAWESSDGQSGKSYLGRSAGDSEIRKFFRDVLGIKTTSDFNSFGCR